MSVDVFAAIDRFLASPGLAESTRRSYGFDLRDFSRWLEQAGLDLERVLEAVAGGAAGSWSLSNYAPRMLSGDFAPGFVVEHFLKDMGIALAEAEKMNLALPGLALAKQLYEAVRAQGYGRKGTQALMLALEHISNVKR
jgi:3-hydroxyisobutyrate dehydrogenase